MSFLEEKKRKKKEQEIENTSGWWILFAYTWGKRSMISVDRCLSTIDEKRIGIPVNTV